MHKLSVSHRHTSIVHKLSMILAPCRAPFIFDGLQCAYLTVIPFFLMLS